MGQPEQIIVLLNAVIVGLAYFLIYPRVAGSDVNKIMMNDLLASSVSLGVAGFLFWDSRQEFYAVFFHLNWFWFSLLTYMVIELPAFIWYCRKYGVRFS